MKFLFIMTVAVLLPLELTTAAWAEPTQINTTTASESNLDSDPTLTSGSTTSEQIYPISIEQNPELVSPDQRSSRLSSQAQQINQSLGNRPSVNQQIRELLNLPDGMIIRGSSRGGLGIGAEY